MELGLVCFALQGRVVFDVNGIRFNTTVRLLQYRNGLLIIIFTKPPLIFIHLILISGYLQPFGFYINNKITFIDGESVDTIFPSKYN